MLNASVDLLNHLGHKAYADVIKDAIHQTICVDRVHTADLGGTASSKDVVDNILKILEEKGAHWLFFFIDFPLIFYRINLALFQAWQIWRLIEARIALL